MHERNKNREGQINGQKSNEAHDLSSKHLNGILTKHGRGTFSYSLAIFVFIFSVAVADFPFTLFFFASFLLIFLAYQKYPVSIPFCI